ncbi:pyridoxamine 5'-phosphate oxidase-related protein FMN-binding [Beutenbergia cavernae DSM 12333]|uniref:Pyridoxamine 5'-phosphate oxidase-related protein FMN-binding n=1 Tax=Beutenbergia cavernae (strain ATCC BAA-8 / DSM 12333 / CCUG 43141 / JCM 11478 / NBRC 16432 / NCIMB 13614 / HKI 0122) TaxID=471853 RepID=C5BZC1_BEUC1|nr:PPOX class F420-dependent oxidoreductase [Beutenbergia cavernae]ACQ79093.1 pyridoxamine 5'-phosphate oxidase-related protein FMN-binding [Beutenbergia cavernae DSM 12333]
MDLDSSHAFVRDHRHGVLATLRRDGRPQLSTVLYGVGDDGALLVSSTAPRAKTRNLGRDPRFSLHIERDDGYAYVVLEGAAELSDVARTPDDAAADALVAYYRLALGEHPDWDDYRRAMVADQRLLLTLRPERAYGMLELPLPS